MASADNGAREVTGTNYIWPSRQGSVITSPVVNLAVASEAPLLADSVDTNDEKACKEAFQLIMQGFHKATRTLSDEYQEGCMEVQGIVRKSLRKSTFVWGALATICRWVKAVCPAMDHMGESMQEQSHPLQQAQKAEKEATEHILVLLPVEDNPYLPPVIPQNDI